MQFDNCEMAAIAQAEGQPTQARLDIYGVIHKAVRAALCDALVLLGRSDPQDDADLDEMAERVRGLLVFCGQHLRHENDFLHPALEARAVGTSAEVSDDHVEHVASIRSLEQQLQQLMQTPAPARNAAALSFYHRLSHFVAENLEHMLVEESRHNAALWQHYNDAELAEIHNALVGSIPPAEMMDTLHWMLPHMHHAERVEMLLDMRAHAPAPAWDAALGVARQRLSERDWGKLERALAAA